MLENVEIFEKKGTSKQRDRPKNAGNVQTERQAEKMTKPIPKSLRYASQAYKTKAVEETGSNFRIHFAI